MRVVWILVSWALMFPASSFAVTYGLQEVTETELASFAKAPAYRAFLPSRVDLSPKMPRPGNQGEIAACAAWSLSYGIQGFYEGQTATGATLSPSFVYDAVVSPSGDCGAGLKLGSVIKFLRDVGTLPVLKYPIKTKDCSFSQSKPVATSPLNRRIYSTQILGNLDSVKGELHRGRPVFFGMNVPGNFKDFRGHDVYSVPQGGYEGGHAMVIVGYDDSKAAFRIMNSWGEEWGDGGFAWVSYEVALSSNPIFLAVAPEKTPKKEEPIAPKTEPADAKRPVVGPRPPPESKERVEEKISREEVLEVVRNWNDGSRCGRISADLNDRSIKLTGVFSSIDDRKALLARLAQLGGRPKIMDESSVRSWPACELYATVTGLEGLNAKTDLRVSASALEPRAGSNLVLKVSGKGGSGFLSIFYLQADGSAVALESDRKVSSKLNIVIGDKNDSRRLTVSPPYGDEGIVAVLSKNRDAVIVPEGGIIDRDFLTRLRIGLLKEAEKGNLEGTSIELVRTRE